MISNDRRLEDERLTRNAPAPQAPPYGERYTDQIAGFIEVLQQGRPPEVMVANGRAALVLAIYRTPSLRCAVGLDEEPAKEVD